MKEKVIKIVILTFLILQVSREIYSYLQADLSAYGYFFHNFEEKGGSRLIFDLIGIILTLVLTSYPALRLTVKTWSTVKRQQVDSLLLLGVFIFDGVFSGFFLPADYSITQLFFALIMLVLILTNIYLNFNSVPPPGSNQISVGPDPVIEALHRKGYFNGD